MLFKNAKFAKLVKFEIDYEKLQELLTQQNYIPTTPHQESAIGWVSPFGDDGEVMSLTQGRAHLLKMKIEEKKVPASTINDELQKKIKYLREKDPSIKISKVEKANLKDEIKNQLLPKVLPSFSYMEMYLDIDNNLLVLNGTSDKKWEVMISHLTKLAGDDFEFQYFETEEDPSNAMTDWVKGLDIPTGFKAGDECKLKDIGEEKTEITYKKHNLHDEKISDYLGSMKIIKLALELDDEISFHIDSAINLSKIKFLDMYKEKRKEDLDSAEDEQSRFKMELDVDFAIMKGAFAEFLPKVIGMFKEE